MAVIMIIINIIIIKLGSFSHNRRRQSSPDPKHQPGQPATGQHRRRQSTRLPRSDRWRRPPRGGLLERSNLGERVGLDECVAATAAAGCGGRSRSREISWLHKPGHGRQLCA